MGKDAYLFRITGPELEDRTYNSEELVEKSIQFFTAEDAKDPAFHHILPFCTPVNISMRVIDQSALAKHCNMQAPDICAWRGNGDIIVHDCADASKGTMTLSLKDQFALSHEETSSSYAFIREPLAKWKNDDIITDVLAEVYPEMENCGYYPVTQELLPKIKEASSHQIHVSYEPGLFYYEWY